MKKPSLSAFTLLPLPVKLALFAVTGGGVAGLLMLAYMVQPQLAYVVFAVMAALAVVVVAYRFVLKKLDKGKSKPFEQKLGENSSATPSGVSDAGARARLDDLRKKFSTGIQTFKDHGKDLYVMPWYVLVGEPGSGKTEAIRHCNVGFPPGLQDQLQGAGGTLNMNWWFTNYSVILDTAGRLMFEDVAPGQTNEWKEFLKLLRQARPTCPINGMLLVIPADSLIKDNQNDVETKGGKIAAQLDEIQRSLGVRFPVFVIITKSDLINGFREFFNDLNDPVLAHQILGWSNPASLDTPFDPQAVEEHLRTVRESLITRRLNLLNDPVHREDPQHGRRTDEVDSLYAFPDAMLSISSRLRRYLEMIFVAGTWSQKPLFLRGIYFTSSMRDGAALDEDLAQALGVDVESLPDGKVWERDRAYFLRDLFIEKVFREKGLVTRANNAEKLKTRRRGILLLGGFLLVAIAGAWTWFSHKELQESMIRPAEFWSLAEDVTDDTGNRELFFKDASTSDYAYLGAYQPDVPDGSGREKKTLVELQREAMTWAKSPPKLDFIYSWVAMLSRAGGSDARVAQRAYFELGVMKPALGLTIDRVEQVNRSGGEWPEGATGALEQLLRMEASAAGVDLAGAGALNGFELKPLGSFVLADNEVELEDWRNRTDAEALQEVVVYTYSDGAGDWPPVELMGDGRREKLDAFVGSFISFWESGGGPDGSPLGRLAALDRAIDEFAASEESLWTLPEMRGVETRTDYDDAYEAWRRQYAELVEREGRLSTLLGELSDTLRESGVALRESTETRMLDKMRAAFDQVLSALPEAVDSDGDDAAWLGAIRDRLSAARNSITSAMREEVERVVNSLEERRPSFIQPLGGGARPYSTRFEMYRRANDALVEPSPMPDFTAAGPVLRGLTERRSEAEQSITRDRENVMEARDVPAMARASESSIRALGHAYERQAHDAIRHVLGSLSGARAFDALIASQTGSAQAVSLPRVPLSKLEAGASVDQKFLPDGAGVVIDTMGQIERYLSPTTDRPAPVLDVQGLRRLPAYESVRGDAVAYLRSYIDYWTNAVVDDAMPIVTPAPRDADSAWSSYQNALGQMTIRDARTSLEALSQLIVAALERVNVEQLQALGGPFASAVDAAIAPLGASRNDLTSKLRDEQFIRRADDARSEWRRLSQGAADARSDVVYLEPEIFRDRYLGVYNESAGRSPVERYFSELVYGALVHLVAEANAEAEKARSFLLDRGEAFPICRDASPEAPISVADARELLRATDLLGAGGGDGAQGGRERGERMADGDFGPLTERVRTKVRELIGEGARLKSVERALAMKVGRVVRLLVGSDGLSGRLVLPGTNVQYGIDAWGDLRHAQITSGGTTYPRDPVKDKERLFDGFGKPTPIAVDLPMSAPITFTFFEEENAPSNASAVVDAPWGMLRFLENVDGNEVDPSAAHAYRIRINDDDIRGDGLPSGDLGEWVYLVDVGVLNPQGGPRRGGDGRPLKYRIGVRFGEGELPDVEDAWPTRADWERAR